MLVEAIKYVTLNLLIPDLQGFKLMHSPSTNDKSTSYDNCFIPTGSVPVLNISGIIRGNLSSTAYCITSFIIYFSFRALFPSPYPNRLSFPLSSSITQRNFSLLPNRTERTRIPLKTILIFPKERKLNCVSPSTIFPISFTVRSTIAINSTSCSKAALFRLCSTTTVAPERSKRLF